MWSEIRSPAVEDMASVLMYSLWKMPMVLSHKTYVPLRLINVVECQSTDALMWKQIELRIEWMSIAQEKQKKEKEKKRDDSSIGCEWFSLLAHWLAGRNERDARVREVHMDTGVKLRDCSRNGETPFQMRTRASQRKSLSSRWESQYLTGNPSSLRLQSPVIDHWSSNVA